MVPQSEAGSTTSADKSRPNPSRLPSLTQLAARISERSPAVNSPSNQSPSSAARPRLATSLLSRTSSATGTSPATNSDGSPDSATPKLDSTTEPSAPPPSAIDATTKDATHHEDKQEMPRGYKNVPSLEAITERLGMVRVKSSEPATLPTATNQENGTASSTLEKSQPEPAKASDTEVDEATGDASQEEADHPLQYVWTLYHDSKSRVPYQNPLTANANDPQSPFIPPPTTETGVYEAGLTVVGEFNTVEGFCRYFNWLKPPSQLEKNSNYHLFKDGIKPMWEDKANTNGGKWVLTMKNNPQLLDRCWSWLAMGLVGEELDERDEICGAVVSLRAKIDRIQLWLRSKDDIERINSLGKKLVKLLDVGNEPGVGLEFQFNTDERPSHTKFISIVPQHQASSYFRPRYQAPGETPPATATDAPLNSAPSNVEGFSIGHGGGMGSFSTGAPVSGWRGGRGGGRGGSAFGSFGGGVGLGVARPNPVGGSAIIGHGRTNSSGAS